MTSPARTASSRQAPRRGAALALAAVCALAGCTADTGAAELQALAARADRLADHLDANDGCAAQDEAALLLAAAEADLASGAIRTEVVEDVRGVVQDVTGAVPCDVDEAADDGDQSADDGPADDGPADEDQPNEQPARSEERDPPSGDGGNAGKGNGRGDGPPPGRGRGNKP